MIRDIALGVLLVITLPLWLPLTWLIALGALLLEVGRGAREEIRKFVARRATR